MLKKQIAPGGDVRDRLIAVDGNSACRESVKGFSWIFGIDEYVEVNIQGPPGLRVKAKGQGAADRMIDSRGAKESGDRYRQLRWSQVPRCSRHRRFSRAQSMG